MEIWRFFLMKTYHGHLHFLSKANFVYQLRSLICLIDKQTDLWTSRCQGPAIVHALPKQVRTFDEYSDSLFTMGKKNILQNWDIYKPDSLKESTRGKAKWPDKITIQFPGLPSGFEELFSFLTDKVSSYDFPSGKGVQVKKQNNIFNASAGKILLNISTWVGGILSISCASLRKVLASNHSVL